MYDAVAHSAYRQTSPSVAIELPGYLSSIQPGLDRPADQLSVSLLENPLANQRRKLQKPYNYTTALPSPLLRHITAR
ncbi:unnamed protein product [Clavelina lepadiformis]|uniref:Uncharacterized protein n=1 Tax=Clavelina lepadiformis TaxID=159417 RepID=A0ABP0GC12_CLALP